MKIVNYSHNITASLALPEYFNRYYSGSKPAFFDIETTGLSAVNSTLYLIGALWFEDNTIYIRQWFNDDGYSEGELLEAFNEFCMNYTHLVHFNGLTFDIPYLCQKADTLRYDSPSWNSLSQIDIYKDIRSYKRLFGLENIRQVSIEAYLGIKREDTLSGKELINVYQRYIARPDETKESLLLLHNHDDLLGMPAVSHILAYKALFEDIDIMLDSFNADINERTLTMDFTTNDSCRVPKRIVITNRHGIFLNAMDNSIHIEIPLLNDTLKHYFTDYKNYYYLPREDMAIHKSVATYVEPENRTKATRQTCYTKKSAAFIPCFDKAFPEIFKKDFKDKSYYITTDSLLKASDSDKLEYIQSVLHGFL